MKSLYWFAALALVFALPARAAGKKRPEPEAPKPMKRAIVLDSIADRYIELPDPAAPVAKYGRNIETELAVSLQKTRDYAVLLGDELGVTSSALSIIESPPDPCIINFGSKLPSSRISIAVNELSFVTGSRAERMLYGFTREFQNPYNAGVSEASRNEFPLRTITAEPGWFENAFADTGGLTTGMELGHEVNFDLLFLGAKLKHQAYHARLGLDVVFDNRFGPKIRRQVDSSGEGFYFDLSAHFAFQGADFMAGVLLARKTALLDAFHRTITAAVEAVSHEVGAMPFVTRLAARCGDGIFIEGGADMRVPAGQRFYDLTQLNSGVKPTVFHVEEVFSRSSRVRIVGDGYRFGDELVSLRPGEAVPEPKPSVASMAARALASEDGASTLQSIDAGKFDFDVATGLERFIESFFTRLWEGIKALFTLPYRAYRYFNYDQEYGGGELKQISVARAFELASQSWAARSIGLDAAFRGCAKSDCLGRRELIVAVIDTGVDYNHPELRRNIFWDGTREMPGFDFISGDPHPYDDHEHGTTVASVIAGGGSSLIGVAPNVTLLPIKAFSPYGLTTSAALYGAFEYAVSSGAKIIVAGWGTQRYSKALEDGVRLAEANGVLTIAAAGDGGLDLEKRPYYPAAFAGALGLKNMLVVAGYDDSGALTRAPGMYSNYGRSVDLAAPGGGVRVATPRSSYELRSSTGIAAGFVAGAAALVWSRCLKGNAALIKRALLESTRSQDALRGEIPEDRALSISQALEKIKLICK